MKFQVLLSFLFMLIGTSAFAPPKSPNVVVARRPTTVLSAHQQPNEKSNSNSNSNKNKNKNSYNNNNNNNNNQNDLQRQLQRSTKAGASFIAGAAIFTSALVGDLAVAPPPAHAELELELSRGSFVIETTMTSPTGAPRAVGDIAPLLKTTEIDSKRLIKTLFVNRKELAASLERIQSAIGKELTTDPVWMELQKELISIEGDVKSSVKISPPVDWKQAVQDATSGKVNLLYNGEIINIVVEPNFSATEDDLVIRIKGFKGEPIAGFEPSGQGGSRLGPIRQKLLEYEEFWQWSDAPYPEKYLPLKGMQATNGGIIITGAALSVWLVYIASYGYYTQQIDAAEVAAEAKRAAIAERMALKKKKEAEQTAKDKAEQQPVADKKEVKQQPVADGEEVNKDAKVNDEEQVKVSDEEQVEVKDEEQEQDEPKKRQGLRFWKKN